MITQSEVSGALSREDWFLLTNITHEEWISQRHGDPARLDREMRDIILSRPQVKTPAQRSYPFCSSTRAKSRGVLLRGNVEIKIDLRRPRQKLHWVYSFQA